MVGHTWGTTISNRDRPLETLAVTQKCVPPSVKRTFPDENPVSFQPGSALQNAQVEHTLIILIRRALFESIPYGSSQVRPTYYSSSVKSVYSVD